jgi:hypothetical protein
VFAITHKYHQANENTGGEMRESKEINTVLVYLKTDAGCIQKDSSNELRIFTHLYLVCFHCLSSSDNSVTYLTWLTLTDNTKKQPPAKTSDEIQFSMAIMYESKVTSDPNKGIQILFVHNVHSEQLSTITCLEVKERTIQHQSLKEAVQEQFDAGLKTVGNQEYCGSLDQKQ